MKIKDVLLDDEISLFIGHLRDFMFFALLSKIRLGVLSVAYNRIRLFLFKDFLLTFLCK